MSRKIMQLHEGKKEAYLRETVSDKLVITAYKGRELGLLFKKNRLVEVHTLDNSSKIGAIYIGKVKNVVKNLNACFVEIADGELCFLPLGDAKQPMLLNRSFDGRILQGDELLVQVQRDALKTKQAALTCNITLQSELFVFETGSTKVGISNKLSAELKNKLRECLLQQGVTDDAGYLRQKEGLPEYGCVVRTEAGKLFADNVDAFLQEFEKAETEFAQLLDSAKYRTCFSCIKAPKKPYEAILSKVHTNDYVEVITDLPEAYTSLQGYVDNIRCYEDADFSLEKLYTIETKLQEALAKNVWLKSGAYLVIEQTECLTTIDVNSGKMIQGTDKEEAILKINEEAAKEAALQIRLRNLSGIIIIDFINMKDSAEEERLLFLMKELVATDGGLTKVVDITPLGLMELTRKKVCPSLKEQLGDLFRKA